MSICVFGDSIAWGAYDPVNGGWVTLLRNHIEEKTGIVSVYNLGICGNTTTTILTRLDHEIANRTPIDLLAFAIGINDSSNWNVGSKPVIPPKQFKANLHQITQISNKYTNKIIFVGLTPVDEKITNPFDTENTFLLDQTRQYDQMIREYCSQNNLVFVDIMNSLTLSDIDDGVHPNTEGHKKIFEAVKPVVEKLLVL